MLGEVQGITESAAAGIADEHPSFRRLMEAFGRAERTGGSTHGEAMLQNCEVSCTVKSWIDRLTLQIRNLKDGTANGRRLNTVRRIVPLAMCADDLLGSSQEGLPQHAWSG